MTRTVVIIFVFCLLPICLPQMVERPFQIVLTSRITNTITLQCRQTTTNQPIFNAMYFLNGTELENFTELQQDDDQDVSFQMTRDLEGYFTCGNNSSVSNPLALIAIPDSMLFSSPPPVYAILGEQVRLNCVIPPGQLIQQYFVTWDRAGRAIYQSSNSPPTIDDRYSIDPSSLSLIIENVQLEDASEEYHCVFVVSDPNVMQTHMYTNLLSYDIQLTVLADPVINEPPSENITIEGHNASFTCSVRGFPAPLVEWELNGMVLSSDSHSRRDGNYMITSSALMIMSVTFEMNGVVRCIGRTPSTFTGNRVLDQANSTTTLVIYSPPSIDQSRLRSSIVAEGENTSFVCSAQGYPAPMVTWFLNGTQVLPQDLRKDLEVYNRSSQSGPYNVTTSRLLITQAQQRLNVEVQCLASSTNVDIYLPDDNKTVQLVVLGSFDLRVDVTQGGDVLFEVTLPTPLSKPVNLIMEYVNLDNPLRRKNVTTNVAYIAKTSFLHLEPSSRVPFDRFRVSVRLTSSFIIGPPIEDINDRAKNRPTLVDPNVLNLERHKHNLWGAVFGGILFGMLVLLFLCCISCLCYKVQKTRMILSKPEKLLETYMEQIRCESNSENIRKELIEKANKLAKDIISYRSERRSTRVTSDNNQEKNKTTLCCCVKRSYTKSSATPSNSQGNNGTEMTRIRTDCDIPAASGPLPPPLSTVSQSSLPQPHPATGNKNQTEVSHGSTASLIDEALDAFVRDLRGITE